MVAWSGLLRSVGQILSRGTGILAKNSAQNGIVQKRLMSEHRTMSIEPSRWQWHKTKDLLHLYTLVGAIPCVITIMLSQIFVGPAELQPIPEGYVPKPWEYYRDPISRFIARYIYNPPQMEYEKYLHYLWEESELIKIRRLEAQIHDLMYERKDYRAYYYQPYEGKYIRSSYKWEADARDLYKGS
ncbi:NADH dehydrogenase [ubiquinone] 1 beta subcomplex subunit 5, mitochondrial [Venturia canescens]|uniref:NADH dehydrogenase [ubiquinone] 1 beta subcomplex subunit 5, mitochondrial n=1 Tax=Venturia canescens TaxID=32260 RepID=UPI001C9CB1B7|nr:NADH dehydrogenase [ubiquinone] 1 beta subcomplex subunit 5, mitochondrial [Venturia canescens]